MKLSRRRFLKYAGITTAGAASIGFGANSVLNAFASSEKSENTSKKEPEFASYDNALTAERWAMVIDTRKIKSAHDVEPMIQACNSIHNIPKIPKKKHEIKWIWETEYQHAFTNKVNEFMSERIKDLPFLVLCNHCEKPACVRACPTGATFQREDGIVMMDYHRCIGCRFCMAACAYGSRSFNFVDPVPYIKEMNVNFPHRMRGVVEKCNFCAERLAKGKLPACVEASKGILTFGDLYDPHSDVRKLLNENYTVRRKTVLGLNPSVYYII